MYLRSRLIITALMMFLLAFNSIHIAEIPAAVVPVPESSLLSDALTQNFTGVPVGPISGSSSAFASINVSNASLIGSFYADGDALDSGVDGNALVSNGGTLSVQAVDGPLDDTNAGAGFRFDLAVPATQIGFLWVDQSGVNAEIEIYSGGSSLGVTTSNMDYGVFYLFESSQPFDAIEIRDISGGGGWGLDNITLAGFQDGVAVPTMNEWGMIIFAILAGLGAIYYVRRQKGSTR